MGGSHPGVFEFIDKLRKINSTEESRYVQSTHLVALTRRRSRTEILQDLRIGDAQSNLVSGWCDMREFLITLKHCTSNLERSLRGDVGAFLAPQLVPEVVAPEVIAPEVVTPEVIAPEVVAPEVIAPEGVVP